MSIALSQEQLMLQTSAQEFFTKQQPIERFRTERDKHSVVYSDAALWQHMVELGWAAILLPCLLYTSPSPRDKRQSRMPSSA